MKLKQELEKTIVGTWRKYKDIFGNDTSICREYLNELESSKQLMKS